MDKATLDRLFEPFFTTKPLGKGTGLGLATVYGIVKQSGGNIFASSEPGQGTTFKVYLPLTDAEPEMTPIVASAERQRGNGELILLVEDEPPLRELCETVLSRLGYRVSTAGNGLEALVLVQERGLVPALVVTDVIMPGICGAEMAERLRRKQPGLKVLYMSGYPDEAIASHGVLEPGIPFIQKPFTEQALGAKVRETLNGKAATVRRGRSVLMIDDDEQYRELVRHFCVKRGHVFAGVGDAAAALAALAKQSFGVLLVDKNIPGTSGEHILREIRAAGHATPAIVLTGDVASADMNLLRPLGVVRALEKSSDAEPLLRAIEEADLA
jgi:DNA-binding NtrC family response regulator